MAIKVGINAYGSTGPQRVSCLYESKRTGQRADRGEQRSVRLQGNAALTRTTPCKAVHCAVKVDGDYMVVRG